MLNSFSPLTSGSWLDWSDWSTLARFYSPEQAYGNSKVAQVLSTQHLARIMDTQVRGKLMIKDIMTKPVLSGPWCEGVQHPPWYCLHRPLCQCLVDEANVSVGQVCDTLWCLLSSDPILRHLRAVMKTPEQGGDTLVHAVMDPDLVTRGSGLHLENHRFLSAVKNKDYPH